MKRPGRRRSPGSRARVGLELLPDAGGDVGVDGEEFVDHLRRGRRAQQLRRLQLPAEEQVVGAAAADHHARAGTVDLGIGRQGRRLPHQVGTFDQHIGRGEADALGAQRIDREEADVGLTALDRLDRLGRGVEGQQHQADAELLARRRARSTETPTASPLAGSRRARIGLPRLIEARRRPVGASPARTSAEIGDLLAQAPASRNGEAPVQVTMRRREMEERMRRW
jgi:hypothetical protein